MILIMRPVRVLQRHWKLTSVAIFSLSIAMALGVLSFSITNMFFILPPAGTSPDRLVMMYTRSPGENIGHVSYADYKYYRENNHVFAELAAAPVSIQIQTSFDDHREVKIVGRPVSDNYFDVMGIQPYLGTFFSHRDDNTKAQIATSLAEVPVPLKQENGSVRVLRRHTAFLPKASAGGQGR